MNKKQVFYHIVITKPHNGQTHNSIKIMELDTTEKSVISRD